MSDRYTGALLMAGELTLQALTQGAHGTPALLCAYGNEITLADPGMRSQLGEAAFKVVPVPVRRWVTQLFPDMPAL